MLFGIQASQDIKLSNIARALKEAIPLIKTETRLSRNLRAEELEKELTEQLVKMGSQRVQSNTVLALDLSDIRKEYAQKMEYLAEVRDGSSGEIHPGYWLCDVTAAEVNGSEIVPLYQKLYSAEANDFSSENAQVLAAIDRVRAHTRGRAIWTIDRRGDRKKLLEPLLERAERFVIRSTGKRSVVDRRDLKGSVAEVAGRQETFRFVKQSYNLEDIRVMKYQRLKSLVVWVTAAAYFAATFLGQKMKLRILCEKLLVISRRFFGIPPFRFYALAEGIRKILSQTSPNPPPEPTASLQLELLLGWEA